MILGSRKASMGWRSWHERMSQTDMITIVGAAMALILVARALPGFGLPKRWLGMMAALWVALIVAVAVIANHYRI